MILDYDALILENDELDIGFNLPYDSSYTDIDTSYMALDI